MVGFFFLKIKVYLAHLIVDVARFGVAYLDLKL
jgi:hypothetical protein